MLVATDFSKGSENAIKYAKEIAKKNGSKITYVHAYTPPILDPNIPVGMIEETFKVTLEILEKNLKEIIEKDKTDGIESDYNLSFSDLSSVINEITDKEKVGLLVLGKTGHRTFLDKLIGSTANHVIDNIHVPMMVIPEDFSGDIFGNHGYASQLEFDEEQYIENALIFSKPTKSNLKIVHIIEENEIDLYPDQIFIKEIYEKFGNSNIEIIESKNKNLEKGLNEIIEKESINVLSLTTHKRGFLDGILNPSKTKKLIGHSKIPILVFSIE